MLAGILKEGLAGGIVDHGFQAGTGFASAGDPAVLRDDALHGAGHGVDVHMPVRTSPGRRHVPSAARGLQVKAARTRRHAATGQMNVFGPFFQKGTACLGLGNVAARRVAAEEWGSKARLCPGSPRQHRMKFFYPGSRVAGKKGKGRQAVLF